MKKVIMLLGCLIFFGCFVLTLQDISRGKDCDCSKCNSGGNRLNPIVNRKHEEKGKSSCTICERRKEMLRMERQRQKQFEKCPFEILGAPAMRGKTSEEIFDEFRELIIPSQNSFFDMMRGIVRTVHVSTEAELKQAKEKEARELAEKRAEEARALKIKPITKESPKVTVVLKQTPCGQVLKQKQEIQPARVPLIKRLPKEIRDAFPFLDEDFKPNDNLQLLDYPYVESTSTLYPQLDVEKSSENEELYQHYINSELLTAPYPGYTPSMEDDRSEINEVDTVTESPFVKFMSNEELRSQSGRSSPGDFVDLGLEPLVDPYFSSDWGLMDVKDQQNFISPPPTH